MDYPADRAFEPASRPGPLVAMEMMLSLASHMAALDRSRQPASIRAMESIANPADHAAATDRSRQFGSVRAMEPIPNPGDHAAVPGRSPRSASVRGAEPRPNPAPSPEADAESRTRSLVRQHPWTTRFWMELTPAQQSRIERQLHRGDVRLAGERADAPAAWDSMGLADRVGLVFGKGPSSEHPPPADGRDGSTLAGSS
jgi:hypothetical protein